MIRSYLTDGWLLARASVDLIRIDIALRRYGFHDIMTAVNRIPIADPSTLRPRDVRLAQRYARRIRDASKFSLPWAQCLHRSLVLHRWLRLHGLPSELQIGVLKDGQALRAHAWVELNGHVLNDPPQAVAAFTRLASLDPSSSSSTLFGTSTGSIRWQ